MTTHGSWNWPEFELLVSGRSGLESSLSSFLISFRDFFLASILFIVDLRSSFRLPCFWPLALLERFLFGFGRFISDAKISYLDPDFLDYLADLDRLNFPYVLICFKLLISSFFLWFYIDYGSFAINLPLEWFMSIFNFETAFFLKLK